MKLVLLIPPDREGAWRDSDIVQLAFIWAEEKLKQAETGRFIKDENEEASVDPVLEILVFKWDDSVLDDRRIMADWLAIADLDRISSQAELIADELRQSFPWLSVDILPCHSLLDSKAIQAEGEGQRANLWSYAGATSFGQGCIPLLS